MQSKKKLKYPVIGSIQFQDHDPTSKNVSVSSGGGTSPNTKCSLNQNTESKLKIKGNVTIPKVTEVNNPILYGKVIKNKFFLFSVNISLKIGYTYSQLKLSFDIISLISLSSLAS